MTMMTIVAHLAMAASPAALDMATYVGPGAGPFVAGGRVELDELGSLDADTLLILSDARRFPAAGVDDLVAFLERGGHLVAAQGPAFEQLLFRQPDGGWGTSAELLASGGDRRDLVDLSASGLDELPRGGNQPGQGRYWMEDGALHAVVEFEVQPGWETIELPARPAPEGHNVLQLRAKGMRGADQLTVEVGEEDGSRWMAVFTLPDEMDVMGMRAADFTFWTDSESVGRGGPGDSLNLANAGYVRLGFAASHQALTPGTYGYAVSDVWTLQVGEEELEKQAPVLEGLSPSYKTFRAEPARYEPEPLVEGIAFDWPGGVVSPVARPTAYVPERGYTFMPWVKAYNERGAWSATPIATTWSHDGGSWTFVGFDASRGNLAELARRLAERLPKGHGLEPGLPDLLEPTAQGPTVQATEGGFTLEGEPWFAHGLNFWPLYVSGLEPGEYFTHWLEPEFYIPELVDQDLALLSELGVNLISVQGHREGLGPQLRDLVSRCGKYGIKVNVFILAHEMFQLTTPVEERGFLDLLRAYDLEGNPNVFGYDIAWEPHFGHYERRQFVAPLFTEWVRTHYGSIEHAEKLWRFKAPRCEGGEFLPSDWRRVDECLDVPTDAQLLEDGPHRLFVAAFRRFADDVISHDYRAVRAAIEEIDDTHLINVRTGYGGTGSQWVVARFAYQVTSGAAHLDLISPEGYGYGPQNITDAALVTQYCRWAAAGKPVFWAELGQNVWQGGERALEIQRQLYVAFADMLNKTDAAGWAGWWYPGGYRVDENSDYGIIASDREPRPAAEVLRATAKELKTGGAKLPAGEPIVFDRSAHPSGIAAVVRDNSGRFAEAFRNSALPPLKTAGTGTTTLTCPFTAVGGAPFEAPAPPEYVNGEITYEAAGGGEVRVTLINTGEAAWAAEDVALLLGEDAVSGERIGLTRDVERFGRLEVTVEAGPGTRLALLSERFGVFGERRRVRE